MVENPESPVPAASKSPLRSSWRQLRRSILWLNLLLLLAVFAAAFFFYRAHLQRVQAEKSLMRLSAEVQSLHRLQSDLEKGLQESRAQLADYHSETEAALAALREQRANLLVQLRDAARSIEKKDGRVRELESQVREATDKIRELDGQNLASQKIIRDSAAGIAFVEVTYTFQDEKGRPLRYAKINASGEPVWDSTGEADASVDGKGPVVYIYASGTGFVVRPGKLLTSRHVAEPWWEEKFAKSMLKSGLRPVRGIFRAFFPNIREPFALVMHRKSDKADLSLLRFDPKALRLTPLNFETQLSSTLLGKPIILIGYPAGLNGLLARVNPEILQKIRYAPRWEAYKMTDQLSRRGLVRPIATWGHLSDVQQHVLTYDALTSSGGSGGPILNLQGKVIGVNESVLKSFPGTNFGIPIRFAAELLHGD